MVVVAFPVAKAVVVAMALDTIIDTDEKLLVKDMTAVVFGTAVGYFSHSAFKPPISWNPEK